MSVPVDPKIQEQYDRNTAEHRAATATIGAELSARQREVAAQVAANKAALAAIGKEIAESGTPSAPRASAQRLEENDISARAEDYQEPDEDAPPEPPATPAPAPRPPAREEDEVPSFRWDDDDPQPPPAPKREQRPTRPPLREPDEDLSDHDWLE